MEENVIVIKADVKRKRITIGEQTLIKTNLLKEHLFVYWIKMDSTHQKIKLKGNAGPVGGLIP